MLRLPSRARAMVAAVAAIFSSAAITHDAAFAQNGSLRPIFLSQSFDGLGGSAISPSPAPMAVIAPTPNATPIALAPPTNQQSQTALVPDILWAQLAALNQNETDIFHAYLPQINPASARQLTFQQADAIFSLAASRRCTILDLFTDKSWRQNKLYFIAGGDMAALMSKYATHSIFPIKGIAGDGKPYSLLAMVIGQGRLYMITDRNNFRYRIPRSPITFIVGSMIMGTIEGPGDLAISGLRGSIWVFSTTILRIVQISPGQARVDTSSLGSRAMSITPMVSASAPNKTAAPRVPELPAHPPR